MDAEISFIPAAEAAASPIVEEPVAKVEAVKEEENAEQVVEINNNQEGVVENEKEGAPDKPAAKIPKKIDYNVDFPGLPTIQATTKASGPWIKPISAAATPETLPWSATIAKIEKTSGAKIEIYEAKDGSVSFHIRGKPADVEKARASLSRKVKAQITREIIVPKDQHRVFIGKQGAQRMKYEQDLIVKLNSRSRKKTATSPRLLVPPKMLREP
ncbi:hypothetical protein L596_015622 [Steinernema carpocapsae]|uniref:Vigilin N-terminal KH domain-containing protein n=1 Tax=Steinernema carpocapsae TaxID=34508 RepID=A0A4U5NGD8_STECR|nr:hypothetical protein L596_015622 [Steinernema carpocapsae]